MFGSFHIGFLLIAAVTALILVLAANTAFNGFPVLGSVLAQHSYLPRQLHTRGDRLAFSNGILFLSAAAVACGGRVPRRSFLADPALHRRGVHIFHTEPDRDGPALDPVAAHTAPIPRRAVTMMRSRVVNTIGFVATGAVLLIVLVTKFLAGAWIAIVAMGALFIVMKMIRNTMTP